MKLLERFFKYVSFDTQSDPASETYPSTGKQLALLNYLVEEMKSIGMTEVEIDANCYVTGTVPATGGLDDKPVIGFIAHVDTSPDMPGANVRPQIIENYDGEDIALGRKLVMKVSEFPELQFFKGHTLVTTDGSTLLGADDKAGIAIIMTAAQYLIDHPEIKRGKIRIGFTPDEEIGRGVDFFDVKRFGAKYAYTVDGGFEGELQYENFNAASAKIEIQGNNVHPGYAKGKMLNAIHVSQRIDSLLPPWERPEHTEGYEGFYHLVSVKGTVENASMEYIIRDHDRDIFEKRKKHIKAIVDFLNSSYEKKVIKLTVKDQYYNMKEMVEPHPGIIEKAVRAMTEAGVTPVILPIRGGTDGSRLSYMGLPCPNLFTGGMNFHSKFEYCSLTTMQKAVWTIINLARFWGE